MKDYKTLDELLTDLTTALESQNNNFSKKVLEFLNRGSECLVREYREHPGARLESRNGDWFSLWAGGVKLDGKLVGYKAIIEKIEEFLK
jgi:hypothetical protein